MNIRRFYLAALGAVVLSTPVAAEMNRLQPDFTFRKVTVPSSNRSSGRITVQIDPAAAPRGPQAPAAAGSTARAAPAARASGGSEWFWDTISPSLSESGPGRLELAINHINNPPGGQGVAAPRLQSMQNIAQAHGVDILRATVGTNVSPALVLALISIESGGQTAVESSAGAVGLMQLMPATAERFGVTDRTIPAENIKGGVAYLEWLMKRFDNDPIIVLAGYNAGEGAVDNNSGVPPYAETRAYVPKVLAAFQVAKGLCQTPPELVSDGCVFAVRNN